MSFLLLKSSGNSVSLNKKKLSTADTKYPSLLKVYVSTSESSPRFLEADGSTPLFRPTISSRYVNWLLLDSKNVNINNSRIASSWKLSRPIWSPLQFKFSFAGFAFDNFIRRSILFRQKRFRIQVVSRSAKRAQKFFWRLFCGSTIELYLCTVVISDIDFHAKVVWAVLALEPLCARKSRSARSSFLNFFSTKDAMNGPSSRHRIDWLLTLILP